MPTYDGNAYEILSQVRYGINEFSTAYVQGTDTTGAFKNPELMRQINNSQNHLWNILFKAFPEYFLKSGSLTFTASVASLPSDCFKIQQVLDSDEHQIDPINVGQKHIIADDGSSHVYYRYGNTIRIDADDVTETGTIWYYSKVRELDTGAASANDTLATTSKAIADYYNGLIIENVTDSTVETLTDYSAARVITPSSFLASGEYYGIVSELPEVFQPLISEYAILQIKKNPRCPLQVSAADIKLFDDMLRSALQSFAGTLDGDMNINDLFNDFEPMI